MSPLANYFSGLMKALEAASKSLLPAHSGLRGHERELFVSQFLAAHIPASASIATNAQAMDYRWAASGLAEGISREQDVLVQRRDVPAFRLAGTTITPVEGVLAAIEVKTRLDASALEDVQKKSASIKELESVRGSRLSSSPEGLTQSPQLCRPVTGVVCFEFGWKDRSSARSAINAALSQTGGPDFVLSLQHGLLVRWESESSFYVLREEDPRDPAPTGSNPTYLRYFSSKQPWKALFSLVLELTERIQRHPLVHADFSPYATGRATPVLRKAS